ncbi:glycosyltransferase family 2 protein [Butyrivibrio proteoclasticus]|uniref:glycosyltransferase family 2 protein n=1 Tax=Butyrivibrio proteoclasticus TaxID=43305 RepID=UPI00047AF89A|nr:glycosyltransferase family A protein [Butyrivibrio proteoclasticus]
MQKPENVAIASVIIPVFNGESLIERCVDNLLEQTYKDLEIIIVDDGSDDSTWEKCRKLKDENGLLIKILHQNKLGVSAARNKGIEEASGQFLFFVDVDDLLEKDAIKKCVSIMETENCELLVFGYFFDIKENDSEIEHIENSYNNTFFSDKDSFRQNLVDLYDANLMYNVWNKTFRKAIIEEYNIRFPLGKPYNEDRDFIRDYIRVVNRVKVISDCFYHYVRTDNSTTGKYREELFEIRKEEYKRLGEFFADIGLNDDKTKEFVARQHIDRVVGCVENLFHVSGQKLTAAEKNYIKKKIKEIINDESTQEALLRTNSRSKKMKVILVPYKMKNVEAVYLLMGMIYYIRSKNPKFFHKLKQSR